MNFKRIIGMALLGVAWVARAACPTPTGQLVVKAGEVIDTTTGLIWARCSVGQSWSGTNCSGSATFHTHEQALALAQAASGWRLPNVKELASIVDRGCQSPAIDSEAFPVVLGNRYWTSSPYVGLASSAWSVGFYSGFVDHYDRAHSFSVRLVRASQ